MKKFFYGAAMLLVVAFMFTGCPKPTDETKSVELEIEFTYNSEPVTLYCTYPADDTFARNSGLPSNTKFLNVYTDLDCTQASTWLIAHGDDNAYAIAESEESILAYKYFAINTKYNVYAVRGEITVSDVKVNGVTYTESRPQ